MFQNKRILLVSAHPDDLEFGLGGLLNKLDKDNILAVIFSDTKNLNDEPIIEELNNSMRIYDISFKLRKDIINMNFVNQEREIKQILYDLKNEYKPDIIFSTSKRSHNPDHRILGESVQAVFQEQTVLFYETVRADYEHRPNLYVKIDGVDLDVKIKAISQYISQLSKRHYAKLELVKSQAVFRGSQIGESYAEAFEIGRMVV